MSPHGARYDSVMTAARTTRGCLLAAVTLFATSSARATPTADRADRNGASRAALPEAAGAKLVEARAHEARGRLVLALAALREALSVMETGAAPDDVLVQTRHRVEELHRSIPRVAFVGALPAGATLSVDGTSKGEARALLLDPGDHEVAVEAPGRMRWRATFHVERSDAREIAVQPGPALGFDELPAAVREAQPEAPTSPFLRAPAAPRLLRFAGQLRLAIPRGMPLMSPLPDRAGETRLCARETCGAAVVGSRGGDDRVDKTLFREVVAGTGMNLSTHAGMVWVSTASELAPTRITAGMTAEKAVLALSGRW